MEPKAIIAQKFPEIVIPLIKGAKKSLHIIMYDWRWYPTVKGSTISQFNFAITEASRRGVFVKALVNNDEVVERLKNIGAEARRLHSKRMLHTKMLLIDERVVVIG